MLHALWRTHHASDRPRAVDEAEMDMSRCGLRSPGHKTRLFAVLGWFGRGGGAIEAPRRSVDRELQENWPAGDY
jgi:hypothetical protein